MKQKLVIGVTGINNTDNPGPGIPVIRGIRDCKDFDVRIVGLAYENLEPGIYMRDLIDKAYLLPYPSSGSEVFIQRLLAIHQKEHFDLIIPNLDAELYLFITQKQRLAQYGIHTFLPTLEQFEERHKSNLPQFGKKYDILVPKSQIITSERELFNLPKDFQYPIFVKGKFYEAYKAYEPYQAVYFFNKLAAKWGLPVVIQEYIQGTEVNAVALGDGNGNLIACVPMRKTYITDKGKAWGGIVINDQNIIHLAQQIMTKTKWRGGMELEIIKTDDQKYYLIEINPRLPAWVYLAVGAGQNIPAALVKLALGQNVEPMTNFKVGTMFIRYSWDLIGDISDFEKININGEL